MIISVTLSKLLIFLVPTCIVTVSPAIEMPPQFHGQFLMRHPLLGIWFHHPREDYDAYQRLNVMFATVFSILAVNAVFFGQGQRSPEQDLSISIYSALLTAPVGVLFPRLFARAAFKAEAQRSEPNLFAALNLRAAVDAAVAKVTNRASEKSRLCIAPKYQSFDFASHQRIRVEYQRRFVFFSENGKIEF
jgi:hypothetical protein